MFPTPTCGDRTIPPVFDPETKVLGALASPRVGQPEAKVVATDMATTPQQSDVDPVLGSLGKNGANLTAESSTSIVFACDKLGNTPGYRLRVQPLFTGPSP